MIYKTEMLDNGVYLLNDSVKLYDIMEDGEGVSYKVDFNEEDLTEAEASEMADIFITTAIKKFIEKNS